MPSANPAPTHAGSFRMFQVAGITVYLHWTWLVVAYIELQFRTSDYSSRAWTVAEYLTLFGIVLLHEFGHALACRQVGGRASEIVLWPLGGIAYVNPPARPGAWLWSIAAGPLVNVALLPLTIGAAVLAGPHGLLHVSADVDRFIDAVMVMNLGLLLFNLLPIYPLDGGQILQALLWFVIGRSKSLMVVSVIGMAAGLAVIALAVTRGEVWIGVLAAFVAMRSWAGFQSARLLARIAAAPRHAEAACPACKAHPLDGNFWQCEHCGTRFDTFASRGVCPGCGAEFPQTRCFDCLHASPMAQWFAQPAARPGQA